MARSEFWNLRLEPGKAYQREVTAGINITAATLDASAAGPQDDLVQVILGYDQETMPVANFHIKKGITHQPLALEFPEGSKVYFEIAGKVPVILTGICGQFSDSDDDEDGDLEFSSDEEETDEEIPTLSECDLPKSKKRKSQDSPTSSKKAKLDASSLIYKKLQKDDETMSSDSEDNDYNPANDTNLSDDATNLPVDETIEDDEDLSDEDECEDEIEAQAEEEDEAEDEDECEEEEDEAEEEEDLDEEDADENEDSYEDMEFEDVEEEECEIEPEPVKPKETPKITNGLSKKEKKAIKENGITKALESPKSAKKAQNGECSTPKSGKPLKESRLTVQPSNEESNKSAETPASKDIEAKDASATSEKKKKKKNKKKEGEKSEPETPAAAKVENSESKTPKSPKAVLRKGGVSVTDILEGKGVPIKRNQTAHMFYKGQLKNGKIFDSCQSGKPFSFKLGAGEVIKGWDIGIEGMKVGGKRQLICPPHMAYGKRGSPPAIPPQATLSFEVKLLGIK